MFASLIVFLYLPLSLALFLFLGVIAVLRRRGLVINLTSVTDMVAFLANPLMFLP